MKFPIIFLVLSLCYNSLAATFTVTPNVVSNDYAGLISFQMTGLSPGETVQIVQYYDFNGDGIVDGPDLAVRGETITDGQAGLVAGATNINVMRDEDGLTNGVILSSFRFALAPELASGVGHYIFRFSSPSNNFPAFSAPFTVRSAAYSQQVVGAVMCNGTNVPNAGVALVQVADGPIVKVIVGTAADASGNYLLKAPAGSYVVIPFWPGFVADFKTAPNIVLTSNATVTTNVYLTAGTTTLSGQLIDFDNPLLPALPYSQISVISTNYQFIIATTDGNANYNLPITPGVWTVRPRWKSAIAKSYLVPEPQPLEDEARFDTLSGPVSGADIALRHATALIYGNVADSQSNRIAGINLSANGDGGMFDGIALSDSNGLYSLAMDQGSGFTEVLDSSDPPASAYLWTGTYFGINNGAAGNLNVIGHLATARMRWQIMDETGVALTNISCFADSETGTTFGNSDTNGLLDMPVYAGVWQLYIGVLVTNLVFPHVPSVTITNGVDFAGEIIARTVTGQISGYLHGMGDMGISNVIITASNSVGITNFTLYGYTDSNGNYAIPVFDGTWNVSVDPDLFGYLPISPTNVTLPPSNAIANFDAQAIPPPQITMTSFTDATVSNYYAITLLATNGSGPLIWSVVSGALPDGLAIQSFGYESDLTGVPINLGLFTFSLKATDGRGSNDTRTLSINVTQPPQPLQITTPYSLGFATGCPVTTPFQATGGNPPYTWTLAAGSGPLPDGLTFGTNGLLTGNPSSVAYFYPTIQVSDSLGAITNEIMSITVSAPLTVSPGALPEGEVGLAYYGYPPVSGGAQPQTWTVVSNSLPPGLSLDPAMGTIGGTPSNTGISSFTLQASDGCVTVDVVLSITNMAALQIATGTLPVASLNIPYNAQLHVSGGVPPFYWYTSDLLPDGLVLNSDGSLTGMPDLAATNQFLAQVYDGVGGFATRTLTITATDQPVLDLPAFAGSRQFTFRITGASNQSYALQVGTSLTNWIDQLTTNAPSDVFFLTDTNASNSTRFYRLRVNP